MDLNVEYVPLISVLTGTRDCGVPYDNRLVGEVTETPDEPVVTSSNIDPTSSNTDDGLADMETETSLGDSVKGSPASLISFGE